MPIRFYFLSCRPVNDRSTCRLTVSLNSASFHFPFLCSLTTFISDNLLCSRYFAFSLFYSLRLQTMLLQVLLLELNTGFKFLLCLLIMYCLILILILLFILFVILHMTYVLHIVLVSFLF